MSIDPSSQSLSISSSQLSDVQIGGIAGGNFNVSLSQHSSQGEGQKPLTQTDVLRFFTQLEELFYSAGLPEAQKKKAVMHLEAAKSEVQAEKPDKDFAVKNFQRATRVLQEAGTTVEATQGLWEKLEMIAQHLAPWFGVAAKSLLLM